MALSSALFSACARSQTQPSTVFGTITDPSGAVIPEAQVTILNQSTGYWIETVVLSFDNADLQSLLTFERPDLVGNPYTGVCPNGSRVGTPSCWFNPTAFALPPLGQFGTAGRNILRGPAFAQCDLALEKGFKLKESTKITFGAEAYNLFNHPNFAVPSNTQSPLTLGGNGDAVFEDAAGNLAKNVGRIFNTAGTGRQIQLDARFTF